MFDLAKLLVAQAHMHSLAWQGTAERCIRLARDSRNTPSSAEHMRCLSLMCVEMSAAYLAFANGETPLLSVTEKKETGDGPNH